VTSGLEGEPVRNRVPRRLVAADPQHEQLVELLVRARLVTSDDGQVELAHEAVARAWPRLRGWLDEDSQGQRILRHLTLAADTWHTMGRPESELYRGTRLAQALDWWADSRPDLTATEQAFLVAGRRLAEVEEHTAAQQARTQARINRRLRGLLAGGVFLLIAVVVAGTLAVRQANRATEASRAADAQRVASQSQLVDRVDQALQLALASLHLDPTAAGRASLLAALARHPQLTSFIPAADQPFWHLDVSPDGDAVAVMDFAGRVRSYNTQSMQRIGGFDPYPQGWATQVACVCDPVAFSPDGEELAVADLTLAQPSVRLLNAQTHRPIDRQLGGLPRSAVPVDIAYSTNGHFLAVTFDRYQPEPLAALGAFAYVWDLRRPAAPLANIPQVGYAPSAELSPDGSLLYTVPGWNNSIPPVTRVFDVATGQQLRSLGKLGHPLTLSPDGSTIAYADGSDVVVLDAATGRQLHRLSGHQGTLLQVQFSDDGELVASVSDDQTAMVWQTSTGRVRERLQLGIGSFPDVRFSADGRRLLATVEDGLMTFDLDGSNRFIRRTAPPDPITYPEGSTSRYVSPHGNAVAVSVYDPKIQADRMHLLDLQTGRRVALGVNFDAVAWRPDGRRLAVSEGDSGRIRILNTASGEVIEQPFTGVADDLMYSSGGTRLLTQTDKGIAVLDAETLRPLTAPVRLEDRNTSLTGFGPTENSAIVTTGDKPRAALDFTQTQSWALLNLDSGQVIRDGRLSGSPASAAMSPDHDRTAFALGGRVEIIDLSTGQSRVSADIGLETESEGEHLTYSDDGSLLVSTDSTGRVSLWDGRTAALLGTVAPNTEMSTPVFLTDDHTVLLAAWDGATYEWDTSVDHAMNFACDVVGHGLTRLHWQQVLPNHAFEPICPKGAAS
jgi:WD40 repeat protein